MELISADICRDGGSLAADFCRVDGSLLSILLEVTNRGTEYGHLHVGSEVQNSCDVRTIVHKGSADERELIVLLDGWLRDRDASSPGAADAERALGRLRELRQALPNRIG